MKMLASAIASLLVVICGWQEISIAEEPHPVVRRIAFWNTGDGFPDFWSDESLAVISVEDPFPRTDPQYIFEYDSEGNPFISIWRPFRAHHVTTDGARYQGFFYWEDTPDSPTAPPTGSYTFTGPDGLILESQAFGYHLCEGTDCTTEARSLGAWELHSLFPGATPRWIILEAVFSK